MRRRVILSIAGVAAAAVTLFALPLGASLRRHFADEELLRLQRDTVSATRSIDLSSTPGDPIELPGNGRTLAVYDRAGRRIAGRGPDRADGLVRSAVARGRPANRDADGRLAVAVPLLKGERVTGGVRAEAGGAVVARRTHRAWLALAGLAIAVVAAAVLAAALVGRRLARPLERLSQAARRLGQGDFSIRPDRAGVAEVDALSSALEATARRLDDMVSRERAFTADASHQLRTPLAALRIELEAMQLGGDPDGELAAALEQVDRLEATIDVLLAVARDVPRAGGPTDVRPLLHQVEDRWRGQLAADGRPLRTLVQDGPPQADASPTVLSEVMDVLVDNAHRHGAGAVTVALREVDGWLAIDVADRGPGFPADPETAFERRVDPSTGHGIGLALARSLVHAEGGRLTVTRTGPHPVVTVFLASAGAAEVSSRRSRATSESR
jgi:signal transduction histidine kinase